eukprot:Skav231127  [mRNA]  locus=scaffold7:224637:234467:+ [translate_table: standard]
MLSGRFRGSSDNLGRAGPFWGAGVPTHMALSHTAPTQDRPGSGSQVFTTTLYEQMKAKGLFKNHFPNIPPAGKSINVPLNDSAQQDLAPEICFPLPATPVNERKFRRICQGPGEICVHHGLKDQLLPSEDFRYGIRGHKGASTEDTMKAGLLLGVAAYQNEVAESVYESSKKEPLGDPAKARKWERAGILFAEIR